MWESRRQPKILRLDAQLPRLEYEINPAVSERRAFIYLKDFYAFKRVDICIYIEVINQNT